MTAPTAIDPMPLPTNPRGDDIAIGACFCQRRNDMLSAACLNLKNTSKSASHVIPAGASALAGIYGRRFKEEKTMNDGPNSYRSHAFAHQPPRG